MPRPRGCCPRYFENCSRGIQPSVEGWVVAEGRQQEVNKRHVVHPRTKAGGFPTFRREANHLDTLEAVRKITRGKVKSVRLLNCIIVHLNEKRKEKRKVLLCREKYPLG